MHDPLRRAFNVLIKSASPQTALAAFRAALQVLITPPLQVGPENRNKPNLDPPPPPQTDGAPPADAAWETSRARLHAIVSAHNTAERYAIAAELGIASSTLRNTISASSSPGAALVERVDKWLRQRDTAEDPQPASAPVRPPPANGADAAPVRRLSAAQREKLALALQLDPRGVRRDAGVSADAAQQAVSGVALASEIVDRLQRYLSI